MQFTSLQGRIITSDRPLSSLGTPTAISNYTKHRHSSCPSLPAAFPDLLALSPTKSSANASCRTSKCEHRPFFQIIFSRIMLNSTGDNGHPCCIPAVLKKKSPTFPFSTNWL